MADPSVIIADAFKAISQSTLTALRAYEQGERARLAEAEDEIRQLRRERDDAFAQVHSMKQQDAAWAVEVDKWKAELDKADLANSHQSDLIAQLRREAQQWKDQCLRLEESSRNEIQDWKDQFLRVDHERARLASKLESILSEQMHFVPPYTPKRVTADPPESSTASSSTKRASTSSLPIFTAEKVQMPPAKKARVPPPTPASRKAATTAPPSQSRIKVVRRVQAVFEVPVKEEDVDPAENGLRPAESIASPVTVKRRKSAAKPRPRRMDIDDQSEDDTDEDGRGEHADGGDIAMGEVQRMRRPSGPNSASRRRIVEEKENEMDDEDEDEDELMMGAEENMNEVYGHRAVPSGRPKSVTNTPAGGRKRKAPADSSITGDTASNATPGRARKRR